MSNSSKEVPDKRAQYAALPFVRDRACAPVSSGDILVRLIEYILLVGIIQGSSCRYQRFASHALFKLHSVHEWMSISIDAGAPLSL